MWKYQDIPATLDEWKAANKKEILHNAQIKAEMPLWNTSGIPYPPCPFQKVNNQPWNNVITGPFQPCYVPMDVDVAQLGGPLTPEEKKQLMDKNWCFYCWNKGHRAARCWKKPNTHRTPNNPFTLLKDTNPFHACAASLEEQSNTSTTTETIIF